MKLKYKDWMARRKALAYKSTQETATDQSQAHDTDINVIVGKMMITRQLPGTGKQPIYADFTELPQDLQGFFEQARRMRHLKDDLPDALKNKSVKDLMSLTKADLVAILQPPDKPADKPTDKPEDKKT